MRVIIWSRYIIPREIKRKQGWENAKAHHESLAIAPKNSLSSHIWVSLALHPLTLGAPRDVLACIFLPRVLVVFSRVNRNHALSCDPTFADRTNHSLSRLVHPSVNAGPTVQMATSSHDRLFGSLKANVTLEHCILTFVARLLLLLCLFGRSLFRLLAFFKGWGYRLAHGCSRLWCFLGYWTFGWFRVSLAGQWITCHSHFV